MGKSTYISAKQGSRVGSDITRRKFMIGGAAGMTFGTELGSAYTRSQPRRIIPSGIAPSRLELAPGKVIDTFAYNDTVPGPVLRVREGRQISVDIRNDTDIDDIVHWHGLYVPSLADGAMELPYGAARRHKTLHLRAQAHWHALVSQSRPEQHRSNII